MPGQEPDAAPWVGAAGHGPVRVRELVGERLSELRELAAEDEVAISAASEEGLVRFLAREGVTLRPALALLDSGELRALWQAGEDQVGLRFVSDGRVAYVCLAQREGCADPSRDPTIIVVVEDVSDLWALERAGALHARYHVLGGVLSALDGVGPEQLNVAGLLARAQDPAVREVIIALPATVDGQTTAHYLGEALASLPVKVTRLAHGVPVGGELDYLDEGTLSAALKRRTAV